MPARRFPLLRIATCGPSRPGVTRPSTTATPHPPHAQAATPWGHLPNPRPERVRDPKPSAELDGTGKGLTDNNAERQRAMQQSHLREWRLSQVGGCMLSPRTQTKLANRSQSTCMRGDATAPDQVEAHGSTWHKSSAPAAIAAIPARRATLIRSPRLRSKPHDAGRCVTASGAAGEWAGSGRAEARPELPNAGAPLAAGTERKSRAVRMIGLVNPLVVPPAGARQQHG